MSTASEEPDHLWFTSPGALTLLIKYSESEFLTMITKYSHYDNQQYSHCDNHQYSHCDNQQYSH